MKDESVKSVLITGCSSGFGFFLVERLLNRGWCVFATMREAYSRPEVFSDLQRQFPKTLRVLSLDIAHQTEIDSIGKIVAEECGGKLDCLINNAGYGQFGPLEELSAYQIRQQFDTNVMGPSFMIRALLPCLREAKGHIINVSSLLGSAGMPLTSTYCASKYALEGLSESLYFELKPHNVKVSLIKPGGHRTDFGRNAAWPESCGTTVYNRQLNNYHRLLKKITSRSPVSPMKVVNKIVKVMELNYPPFEVLVGRDAKVSYFIKKILPGKWYLWSFNWIYKLTFLR